jgi:hypothetical protein
MWKVGGGGGGGGSCGVVEDRVERFVEDLKSKKVMKRTLNSYVNGQTMGCCSSNNYNKVGSDVAYTYYRCSRSKKIG